MIAEKLKLFQKGFNSCGKVLTMEKKFKLLQRNTLFHA